MAELPMADRPEVVLPATDADETAAIDAALRASEGRREALGEVVAAHPRSLDGWAALARHGRDVIERYAFARVGYHRGLDAIRAHGWGGRGYVRWSHATNRGFLRCVALLAAAAAEIGEQDEVERLADFLRTLDPDWQDDYVVQ